MYIYAVGQGVNLQSIRRRTCTLNLCLALVRFQFQIFRWSRFRFAVFPPIQPKNWRQQTPVESISPPSILVPILRSRFGAIYVPPRLPQSETVTWDVSLQEELTIPPLQGHTNRGESFMHVCGVLIWIAARSDPYRLDVPPLNHNFASLTIATAKKGLRSISNKDQWAQCRWVSFLLLEFLVRFNCVRLIIASNLCKARVSKKIGQHDAGKFTFSFIFEN